MLTVCDPFLEANHRLTMSLRLLLRDYPQRSFALVTDTHALVFCHSHPESSAGGLSDGPSSKALASRCMVEFVNIESVDLANYRKACVSGVHGTLGLISINTDVFLCVVSGATRVATVRPSETVHRILSVDFCQYTSSNHYCAFRA